VERLGPSNASRPARCAPHAAVIVLICGELLLPSGKLLARDQSPGLFGWGYRLRLRQEYIENATDFSNASSDINNYLRVRSQLWGSWAPSTQWKLFSMLNNEHRHWYKSNKGLEDKPFEIGEVIFENLSVEGKRLGGTPFGFTAGRQNLFYGEGFICWDGGPLDGSRTAYFNALVFTGSFGKRRLDAHFISDPEKDKYLPVINDQNQSLIEWDETGAGLYYTDESFTGRKLEAYYFYKNEKDKDEVFPESNIHTIGGRVSGRAIQRLTGAAEGAVQLGDRDGADRFGYSGYLYGMYALPVERAPLALGAGALYLSGDDPATGRFEGWNPVYARWPKWSELYIYSLAREKGVAFWQNLSSTWFGIDFKPDERLTLEGRLYLMWAPEGPPEPGSPPFGTGNYRGTLSIVKLNWKLGEYLSGHLLWESLRPGDFYAEGSDRADFLRWEINFKY
jgi:hypothetical protein